MVGRTVLVALLLSSLGPRGIAATRSLYTRRSIASTLRSAVGSGGRPGSGLAFDPHMPANILAYQDHPRADGRTHNDDHALWHFLRRAEGASKRDLTWAKNEIKLRGGKWGGAYVDAKGVLHLPAQEGQRNSDNGTHFAAMHSAMLSHQQHMFGNNPSDLPAIQGDLGQGKDTDNRPKAFVLPDKLKPTLAALPSKLWEVFKTITNPEWLAAIPKLPDGTPDFERLALYVQTSRNAPENDPLFPEATAGLHNQVHMAADDPSGDQKIRMGNPQTAANNRWFNWLHQSIDYVFETFWKVQAPAGAQVTEPEQTAYQTALKNYRALIGQYMTEMMAPEHPMPMPMGTGMDRSVAKAQAEPHRPPRSVLKAIEFGR